MSELALEERVGALHDDRMRAWDLEGISGSATDYGEEVIALTLAVIRREMDAPFLHSHTFEETGMCVDCDACLLLRALADAEVIPAEFERVG